MDGSDEIILWKAPRRGRDAAGEIQDGFDPRAYPGLGAFFARNRSIAEVFEAAYDNGLQEIYIARNFLEELIDRGVVLRDPYYPEEESYHVPPDGLPEFNAAIKQGTPNKYHPKK